MSATRPATLRDVARLASVHVATASRALSPATRSQVKADTAARVLRAARTLGYRPNPIARSLKTSRTQSVGLVIPDLTNPLVPPMVRGAEDVLSAAGYIAWIVNTDNDLEREQVQVQSLRSRQVDGLLVATARRAHPFLESLHGEGVPMVLANRYPDAGVFSSVCADNARGTEAAVRHLVALGHSRIAHVAGPQDLSTGVTRRRGYLQAMRDCGLVEDLTLVVECRAWTEQEGARALGDLLDSGTEVTAVVAAHDRLALGCLGALTARGMRCPEDVSIVGFNDMPFMDKLRPPLTTVRVEHHDVGAEAARLLLDVLADPARGARTVFLPTSLVVRGSTGPVRRKRSAGPAA